MWVPLLLSCLCPIVLILSHYCPNLVSDVSPFCPLSRFWLISVYFVLSFVPIWSSFCHCRFGIVPILSSFEPQLHGKPSGQILVITKTELFSHFLPGHPAAWHNVDNIWTPACLKLSSFCPGNLFNPEFECHSTVYCGWTEARKMLDKIVILSQVWLEIVKPKIG